MSADSKIKMTLRWENFNVSLSRGLQDMLFDKDLTDVTLACQGEYIQAHRNVLSVCSPYFKQLFKVNPCSHPIVILQEAKISHIKSLLSFIYSGETTVPENELSAFLRTAETLRVRGLSDNEMHYEPMVEQNKLQSYEEFTGSAAIKRKRLTDLVVEPQDLQTLDWNLATASTSSANNLTADYVNITQVKNENVESMPMDWGLTTTEDDIVFIGETSHSSVPINNPSVSLPHQGSNVTSIVTMNPNIQPTSSNVSLHSSSAELLNSILIMPQGEQREESINQLVQQVRTNSGGSLQHRYSLPCRTDSEIIQLNQLFENDKEFLARMSASLGLLGGKNPFQAVRRTFSEVIGHEVAGLYRWSGTQGGKKSITKLPNILKLITNASMLNPASRSLTITEVESILKVWLRSSGDREGGRNRRRRRDCANQQKQQKQEQNTTESENHNTEQQHSQSNLQEAPQNSIEQLHIELPNQETQQQVPHPQLHNLNQDQHKTESCYEKPTLTYPSISDNNLNPTNNIQPRPLLTQRRSNDNIVPNIVTPSSTDTTTNNVQNQASVDTV